MLARALNQSANLSDLQGDHLAALNGYIEVIKLLEPLVLDRGRNPKPKYSDGDLLFSAALQPVAYFTQSKKFDRARHYLPNLSVITGRMIESDPDEPDYLRWRARTYLQTAMVAQGSESPREAAAALRSYVEAEREVHHKVGNAATRQDLIDALERSMELLPSLGPDSVPPEWRQEVLSLKQEKDRSPRYE